MERKDPSTAFMKVIEARASEGREVLEIGLPGSLGWLLSITTGLLSHHCAPIRVLSFLGAAPRPRQMSHSPCRNKSLL